MNTTANREVRVRFAPSPTGNLHIGGLRTALFNFLFARHHGGSFLLRIEDTDQDRNNDMYTQSILEAFAWVGIASDEPVVIQSHRFSEHKRLVDQLLAQKKAYYCYCTQEEVAQRHQSLFPGDEFVRYDGHCRSGFVQRPDRAPAIRFAIPDTVTDISFDDAIRGNITVESRQLDDFIIVRSDGVPMYNLVVVIDDAFMRITDIIRGEEHISNTPKQILLYRAFGYDVPQFAHIPLILAPSGARLSKRHGAVSVLEYRDNGYLPHAVINYIARLGWAHGDQEIFSLPELISYFSLDHVASKNAIFDVEKLKWLSAHYIREATVEAVWQYSTQHMSHLSIVNELMHVSDKERVLSGIRLYKDRSITLLDLFSFVRMFYYGPCQVKSNEELKGLFSENDRNYLTSVHHVLSGLDSFTPEALRFAFKQLADTLQVKLVVLANPVRSALQGEPSGPGLFELLSELGKQESLARIACFVSQR